VDSRLVGIALVGAGAAAVLVGLLVMAGGLDWFGRLPGDVRIERGNTRVYVPVATMILLSVVLSALLYLLRRFL
jgi:uncharacterized protein HemY